MRERLVLGPVLIAALVGGLVLDAWIDGLPTPAWLSWTKWSTLPPGVVATLMAIGLDLIAARELAVIFRDKGIEGSKRVLSTAAIAGLLVTAVVPTSFGGGEGAAVVGTAAVLVLMTGLGFYSRHKTFAGIVAAAGGVMLAFVYLGLMLGFVLLIRREHSVWILLWVLLVIKSCDIGAYFTGKAMGRHKLIVWLSPGKTWEGLAGGMALAAAVGAGGLWVIGRYAGEAVPSEWWGVGAGLVFAVVGQTGDLVMSLFKRDAGIKDSGRVLPGFGGVLDVLDSPLLVAPLAYWWLRAAGVA